MDLAKITGLVYSHGGIPPITLGSIAFQAPSAQLLPSPPQPARVAKYYMLRYSATRIPEASPENGFQHAPYPRKNPLSDALAQNAISLVSRHLLTAFHQPADAEARNGMALAGTLAGLAFSNGAVALVHALEYPMGMDVHCSHGCGNALLLPHVMRFNMPYSMTEMADIAEFMGLKGPFTTLVKAAETAI